MARRTPPVPRWGMAMVVGDSMRPGLVPGDRLLLDYRRTPRAGDVVVARLPDGTVATKRATERRTARGGEPAWWLASDDPARGVDSRHHGPIRESEVVAVVLGRIWPLVRRRAVPDS